MPTETLRQGSAGNKLTITITDEAGAAVPLASIETVTLKLYDKDTGDVINSRDNVSILNTNGGSISNGGGYWRFTADDNEMITTTEAIENHVALVKVTTTGGAAMSQELEFYLQRVR